MAEEKNYFKSVYSGEQIEAAIAAVINGEIGGGGGGGVVITGGYYTPVVTQPTTDTMQVGYTPSDASMPNVPATTVNLPKGEKGDVGEQGPQGEQGRDGADGYTPVKGIDYWTDADKQEIVNDVLEDLPTGEAEILAEQTLTGFEYSSSYGAFHLGVNPASYELKAGQKYTVIWDGAEYLRVAFAFTFVDGSSCVAVGNTMVTGGSSSGEPFCIVYDMTNNMLHYFSTEMESAHTVAIYQGNTMNGLPKVTTEDNGKILQVVGGVWKAIAVAESSVKTYIDDYINLAKKAEELSF